VAVTSVNDHASTGEHKQGAQASTPGSKNEHSAAPDKWDVTIKPGPHQVIRLASNSKATGSASPQPEVIWPTWPATIQDETAASASPLADLQEYWSTAGNRLRESAKWMATVLGAALATVVGTSPLAGLSGHHFQVPAAVIGFAGLVCLGVTMLLVLRVMQPPAVSYQDIQEAHLPGGLGRLVPHWIYRHKEGALFHWKQVVESHQDLYLPCGVESLSDLRSSIRLEEATLIQLARTREDAADPAASKRLGRAQAARAARLLELRTAAASITAVGEYYALRARSIQATYGGALFGIIGTAAIVLAFTWPLK